VSEHGSTLFLDKSSAAAFRAFSDLVISGGYGLCISAFPKEELTSGILSKVPTDRLKFVQISMERSPDSIEPTRTVALNARATRFMRDHGKDGVVLMDSLTLITDKNNWETFERFTDRLLLTMKENGCTLIARMRPETITADKLELFKAKFNEMCNARR
jgi:hypothetical protein